ncbi:hydroxymethylglutaryl-CoA lyase [Tomitella biformata]|uniref:hydroxymethylglutaryl-CoA lyase n=1 Tax=Tomitella biformata TaxID=630403 RepID=UPI0004653C48|nr:hydroxymethylglutaryl-CoA lyase [Tomitella biformata]
MAHIEIVEVGPRDGLQNESTLVSTDAKIELIERSIAAGARRIEATSFVHPRLVPHMADAEAVMAGVPRRADVSYIGLVLNRRGFDRAAVAGVDEVNIVVVASETFAQRNQSATVQETVDACVAIAQSAREAGIKSTATIAVAFGCPFEGEVDPAGVLGLVGQVADAGVDEIALADTIGVGTPNQVRHLVAGSAARAPGVPLRMHFHNTRNTGYANAIAALEAGVPVLDASTGGIGGCPFAPAATGNIATEDLVYMLERMGVETGLDAASLISTAQWLGGYLGDEVPSLLTKAGLFPR